MRQIIMNRAVRMTNLQILCLIVFFTCTTDSANSKEKEETYKKLYIFDSPNFLTKTQIDISLLYLETKSYTKCLGKLVNDIKITHLLFSKNDIGRMTYASPIQSHSANGVLPQSIFTQHKRLLKLSYTCKYVRSRLRVELAVGNKLNSRDTPKNVYLGALLGLLIIQDTYNLGIEHLSNGQIRAKDSETVKNSKIENSVNLLGAIDLLALSAHAFNIQWYESSSLFAKHSQRVYNKRINQNMSWYPINFSAWASNFASNKIQPESGPYRKIVKPEHTFLPFSNRGIGKF